MAHDVSVCFNQWLLCTQVQYNVLSITVCSKHSLYHTEVGFVCLFLLFCMPVWFESVNIWQPEQCPCNSSVGYKDIHGGCRLLHTSDRSLPAPALLQCETENIQYHHNVQFLCATQKNYKYKNYILYTSRIIITKLYFRM